MSRLIGVGDIEAAAGGGERSIRVDDGAIITPAARDRARELGITLGDGAPAATAGKPPASVSAPAAGRPATGPEQMPAETLLAMYRYMVMDRRFLEKWASFYQRGILKGGSLRMGEEAVSVGI